MRTSLLGLLLGAVFATVAWTLPAHATSLAPLSTEQLTDAATYIAEGTVTAVWTEADDQGVIWTRARIEVDWYLKGPDQPASLVVDSMGGALGARRTIMQGAAQFSRGEHVVVFLAEIDYGRRLTPVAMHLGKLTVRRAPGEQRSHVMTWHGNEVEPFDHRFLPHPRPEARVYLDDLLDRVETRLDTGWDGQPIPGISPAELAVINTAERRLRR